MSVILFGVSDLANVILAATESAPECDARLALQRTMAEILAAYSAANTAAFRARYEGRHGSDTAVPATAAEILEWVVEPGPAADREAAREFAILGLANVDDFETPALRSAVTAITARIEAA